MNEEEKKDANPLDAIASNGAIPTPEQVIQETNMRQAFARSLADVKALVAEDEDPTVLFRHNWLAQGQSAGLVATTGVGKSSMTMQMALHWALGRPFLAEPMRALKCAIIQAEDSERDIAEQIAGIRLGLCGGETADGERVDGIGWSQKDFDTALKSILLPSHFTGLQGDAFIKALAEYQAHTNCDMLFVNPVQAFFGGDISDQQAVSHWARAGIDVILKNAEHPCAAFMVMHTTKMTSGETKGRANVDDYGEYIGAGSHEWTDWLRAKFVFLKHEKSDVYFEFKAAKRGRRLGWKDNGFPTTNKYFKHSDGFIFWQEVTSEEVKAENTPNGDANDIAYKIAADIKAHGAVQLNEFEKRFASLSNRATIRAAKDILKNNPAKFRLTIKEILVGKNWIRYIGLADSIKETSHADKQQAEINEMNNQSMDDQDDYENIEMPF